jgi:hypothetical protein
VCSLPAGCRCRRLAPGGSFEIARRPLFLALDLNLTLGAVAMANRDRMESAASSGKGVGGALSPELRDYVRQFEDVKSAARHLVEGLSDEQLRWEPAPDRWSIAECFSHLNVTADQYYPAIDRSMRLARERGLLGEGPFVPWQTRFPPSLHTNLRSSKGSARRMVWISLASESCHP